MLYLRRNYPIVRFEDDWNELDSDAVAITFDDGYLDNLEYALPILEELEIPATIFVSTGTMDQTKGIWDTELIHLILEGENVPLFVEILDDEYGCRWNTSTWEYRRNCYNSIHYLMKNYLSSERREKWMAQLWNWRGLARRCKQRDMIVSCDACRTLAESKMITIGAHSVSHSSLAHMDIPVQETEIKDSIDMLSEIINKKITLFSYPFGVEDVDFNDDTVGICRKYGITKAASTMHMLWHPSTDPYRIPRKVVRDWDLSEFDRNIKGYWEE